MTADTEPELLTARNDGLINSFNPVQLSAWRANVDMQYCLSRHRVVEYFAKYATKCEPCSQPLKEVFTNIVRSLKDDNNSLKAVQKLLINMWVRVLSSRNLPSAPPATNVQSIPRLHHTQPRWISCSGRSLG